MNLSVKQYGWFCCAFVLLIISSWHFSRELPHEILDEQKLSSLPDMFIHELTVRKFDEKGELINQLTSPFVQHFPKDNSHILKKPYIVIHQEDNSSMQIRSARARSIHSGDEITFTKDVIVHQMDGSAAPASTLKTEKIIYYAQKKIATTDLPVTFEKAGDIVQSTGMTAYLEEKRVQLLNQARGTYAPKQHS